MSSESASANGGNGMHSYAKNSYYQKIVADNLMATIAEAILENLDFADLSSTSNTIFLADLGCAAGPNTFFAMRNIMETMQKKYHHQCPDSPAPDVFVYFNDLPANDFNTLFTSLPKERNYFAAGVPGSFHGRLFPEQSLHFAYSSVALHWLSKEPEELSNEKSPAWNKGRIHYANAPLEVVNAYASQFAKDMENFLNCRAREIVVGGMMVIMMPGVPFGMPSSRLANSPMYSCMTSILLELAKEGLINEAQVDSFNLAVCSPSSEEITNYVKKNGCFSIVRNELMNPKAWLSAAPISSQIPQWVMHVKAAWEGQFAKHFGDEVVDLLFDRLIIKLADFSDLLDSNYCDDGLLLVILKRILC